MFNKQKKVVYTCLIDDYDDLLDHSFVNPDWDYVCFTDNLDIKNTRNSSWIIKPLVFEELDDVRNQRWHKLHPHLLFPGYDCSLYVDTNINILNDGIFEDIKKSESQKISLGPHFKRKNIYEEFDACLDIGKDDSEIIKKQRYLMEKEGFSGEFGIFFENNIIFRRHNDEDVKKIMNEWWWWIENYSRRDQLSLMYVLWKNNAKIKPLSEITYRNSDKVEFSYKEKHITKEELIVKVGKLERQIELGDIEASKRSKGLDLREEEVELREKKVELREKEVERMKNEINKKNQEIEQKNKELELIRSSKFWKLRNRYVKLKGLNVKYFAEVLKKSIGVLKREGIIIFIKYIYKYIIHGRVYFQSPKNNLQNDYEKWIQKNEKWDKKSIEKEIENFKLKPKISIITPVYNVDPKWLDKCIQSVVDQFYGNWELCLHDDASTKKKTIECLRKWEKKDSRIKVSYGKNNQHISGASNDALKIATGEFVALLDNDDELSPVALYENVKLINKHPDVDFIYSDEDKLELNGIRTDPYFKPDWSPDLLLSMNYICHLVVLRKKIVDEIGGFRKGLEGSQDHDLILRFSEKTTPKKIFHIPNILYHWRKISGSTAEKTESKNYAYFAGKKALEDYLNRKNISGRVLDGIFVGSYRIKRDIEKNELISIIIPTKDKIEYLKPCVESILHKTVYSNYEIIILDTGSREIKTLDFYDEIKKNKKIKIINYPKKEFSFAEANNWATQKAEGEYLLFLNNDTEVINGDWMSSMLEYAQLPGVGAVGAKLLYPNNTVQHIGAVVGMRNSASHPGVHFSDNQYIGFPFLQAKDVVRNVSAVTAACLLIKKEIFKQVGGFDESFKIAFNDMDLCLQLRQANYQIIYTPFAKLIHHESITFGHPYENANRSNEFFEKEKNIFSEKWKLEKFKDPFYSKNLTLEDESLRIEI